MENPKAVVSSPVIVAIKERWGYSMVRSHGDHGRPWLITTIGWGIIESKQGYFSFGKVATGFQDPKPDVMASWIVSAPKIKVKTKEQDNRVEEVAVPMRDGVTLTT